MKRSKQFVVGTLSLYLHTEVISYGIRGAHVHSACSRTLKHVELPLALHDLHAAHLGFQLFTEMVHRWPMAEPRVDVV